MRLTKAKQVQEARDSLARGLMRGREVFAKARSTHASRPSRAQADDDEHPPAEVTHDALMDYHQKALSAVKTFAGLPGARQEGMLLHMFRVAYYVEATGNSSAASELCHDLFTTAEMHDDESYVKAVHDATAPRRESTVSLNEARVALAAHD